MPKRSVPGHRAVICHSGEFSVTRRSCRRNYVLTSFADTVAMNQPARSIFPKESFIFNAMAQGSVQDEAPAFDPPRYDADRLMVQLFVNPDAGGYDRGRVAGFVRQLEADGHIVQLSRCGPAAPVVLHPEAAMLAAVGGDGTLRHVIGALRNFAAKLPVALLPAGTVNLLARELPSAGGMIHPAQINGQTMLACASVGPDSLAVAGVDLALKRRVGRLAYGWAFLKVLARWPQYRIHLESSAGSFDCAAFYVAKAHYFAGPWSFARNAAAANAELHVVALHACGRLAYLRFLWGLLTGRVDKVPDSSQFSCSWLEATGDVPAAVQVDGDPATRLPVRIDLWDRPVPIPMVAKRVGRA